MTVLSYETAKALKDAGWPQPTEWSREGCYLVAPGSVAEQFLRDEPRDDTVYSPNLSELMEACPETLARPAHFPNPAEPWSFLVGVYPPEKPDHWRAGYVLRNESGAYGEGATPEEAVARLWLALEEKGEV